MTIEHRVIDCLDTQHCVAHWIVRAKPTSAVEYLITALIIADVHHCEGLCKLSQREVRIQIICYCKFRY